MENILVATNISKKYGKFEALKDTSLTLSKGAIYSFIGPSGAGKTTLIKLLIGIEEATTGEAFVLDTKVPSLSLLSKIGYMSQSDALYEELTAKENLAFLGKLFKLDKNLLDERIAYTLDLVGLTSKKDILVRNFSGGMKRRLSLAIALINDPDFVVLDEPTVGIDPVLRREIWDELIKLKETKGKTFIVTTHVMDEAEKSDYVYMVNNAEIIANGTPSELVEKYSATNLEDVFIKSCEVTNEN